MSSTIADLTPERQVVTEYSKAASAWRDLGMMPLSRVRLREVALPQVMLSQVFAEDVAAEQAAEPET